MDFKLSEDQQVYAKASAEFFESLPAMESTRAAIEGSAQPISVREELASLDLLGLLAPSRVGGSDATVLDLAVVAEQAGRALIPGCLPGTAGAGVSLLASSEAGAADALIMSAIAGSRGICVAEPISATLTAQGCLNATTRAALDGIFADTVLTLAQGPGGPVVVAVDASAQVPAAPRSHIDPTRGLASFTFDNVPATVLIDADQAQDAWTRALDVARVILAAEDLGTIARALEITLAYAKDRVAFDRTIGSFQAVKHQLVDVYVAQEQLRSLVWLAAWSADAKPESFELYAAAAAAYASEWVDKAGDIMVHIHGGIGFTWEHDAHLFWRRGKVDRLIFGSVSDNRARVARLILAA